MCGFASYRVFALVQGRMGLTPTAWRTRTSAIHRPDWVVFPAPDWGSGAIAAATVTAAPFPVHGISGRLLSDGAENWCGEGQHSGERADDVDRAMAAQYNFDGSSQIHQSVNGVWSPAGRAGRPADRGVVFDKNGPQARRAA